MKLQIIFSIFVAYCFGEYGKFSCKATEKEREPGVGRLGLYGNFDRGFNIFDIAFSY